MTKPATPANVPGDALGPSLAALLHESRSLRTDVHAAEVARRKTALINLGVLGLLVLFVILLLTVTIQNNQLAKQVRVTNDRMVDCTVAGGKCYDEGTRRTGTAIADIVRADIYVAECARQRPGESGPAFDAFIETCVTDKLAAVAKQRVIQPTPSPSGK